MGKDKPKTETENPLAKLQEAELPQKFSDEDFGAVSASAFLPRLQLMISQSERYRQLDQDKWTWYFVTRGQFWHQWNTNL